MTVEAAYATCRRATRAAATNFYYGIRLLPPAKRRALWAVYACCRACDDAVDEHRGGGALRRLAAARSLIDRSFSQGWAADPEPVVVALGDAARSYGLPEEPFRALLAGMEMDIEGRTYATFDELRLYCERVAGSVGLLCVHVFGFQDPAATAMAVDMGIALQLTNILRDVRGDVARGRVYLPQDELNEAGYGLEDLRAGCRTPAFPGFMARQVARARIHFERAADLVDLVEADARLCVMVLHGVYREILDRIEASGYDVFTRRVRVPTCRKLTLVGSLLWRQSALRHGA